MFKILVLQRLHGLADDDTSFQIIDRHSFRAFLGLTAADAVPDGQTISNTMDTSLTGAALSAALGAGQSRPMIFNTDQGSQFTSKEWTGRLEAYGIAVSMDGKGRWMDNVFIERLWRSVKYEEIYLKEYATVDALERGLTQWFERYNSWRPHQALGNRTPAQAYAEDREKESLPLPQEKIAA